MPTRPSAVNPFSSSQLEALHQAALILSTQGLQLAPPVIHPDGTRTTDCPGCGLPSPVTFKYGGPMADCRLCGYGWAVECP
ncbi:hypothetical protein ACQKM2_18610 [Streptomyces sp. NPDC004126]|uniref:hypothetical protein n=1 Tax=Streptomyces sp. NPDC004126 TaxID=3390695 RepID=UPI003D03EC66